MVQTQDRLVSTDAERYLLVYMIGVLLIVCALIIIFFVVFQKRKNKLLIEKMRQKQAFDEEIAKTQLEIQDQTLKNIGQELHDNVGQLLSYTSMQLNLLSSIAQEAIKDKIDDTKEVVKETIQEVRALSKSLNSEVILNMGLKASLENEVARLNKLKTIQAELQVEGDLVELPNPKEEIILFRIIQEFLSNTLKYSEADTLHIVLSYTKEALQVTVTDNGKGFDKNTITKGSGLINMESRAALIKTDFNLTSQPNQGVTLHLRYPLK